MALWEITKFYFDTENNNIKLRLALPTEVEYDFDLATNGEPLDYYSGELYLDGAIQKVGSYRPASTDGTTVPENVSEGETFV
jgi:hypothetical protein